MFWCCIAVPGAQPATIATAHRGGYEVASLLRGCGPLVVGVCSSGFSERGNHECVPLGNHLVVKAGAMPGIAGRQQKSADRFDVFVAFEHTAMFESARN